MTEVKCLSDKKMTKLSQQKKTGGTWVNCAFSATSAEWLQQHPFLFTINRMFFVWSLHLARPSHPGHSTILLRLENPSSVWAKLCTVATSNNREHAPQSLNYCLIAPYVCGVVLRAHAVHGDSGVQVRIWKFCNPDPILNFFINSIFKPYPKSKHYGLRYPI